MSEQNKQNIKNKIQDYVKDVYNLGSNSAKDLVIMQDIRLLAEALVDWIEIKDPDFEFKDFFDPLFIKKVRMLIKNKIAFNSFLASISFSYIDFFHNAVHLMPHVFTSHLITYIKETYINLKEDQPPQVDLNAPANKKYLKRRVSKKEKEQN